MGKSDEKIASSCREDGNTEARSGSASSKEKDGERVVRDPKLNGVWVVITHPLKARVFRPCHHGPDESCTEACGQLPDFATPNVSQNDTDKNGLPLETDRGALEPLNGNVESLEFFKGWKKRGREIEGPLIQKGSIPEYPLPCGAELEHVIPLDAPEDRRLVILLKTICRFEMQRVQRRYGDVIFCRSVDRMFRRLVNNVEEMLKNGTMIVRQRHRASEPKKPLTNVEIPTAEVARMAKLERRKAKLLLMSARLIEEERRWEQEVRRQKDLDDQGQHVADAGPSDRRESMQKRPSMGNRFSASIERSFNKIFNRIELHCHELNLATSDFALAQKQIEETCIQLTQEYQKMAFSDLALLGDPRMDVRNFCNLLNPL